MIMRSMRVFKEGLWIALPFLPLVFFIIPEAFVILSEHGHTAPWYSPYTTPLWIAAGIYVAPCTVLTVLFELKPFGGLHWMLMILYAATISCLLFRVRH